jgi:ArsR family transcriptional regulator
VCDLVALLDQQQPLVSRHLAYLRRVGLVEARRVGRFAHYRLAPSSGPVHRRLLTILRRDLLASPSLAGERAEARVRRTVRRSDPCPPD